MLLKGIAVSSALISAILLAAGVLSPVQALLCFAAGFLGLLLLAFVFLWFCCALVDMDKPQEHDSKFYRRIMYLYIEALASLMQVRIHPKGLENTPTQGRFVLVCNHLSIADPGVIHHCFRKSQLAFVTKQENASLFLINKLQHKTMCQNINRENNREALKTILRCIQLLEEDKVSVCIFPEGYCSVDGRLHPFRPGALKIAQKAQVPVVVCTIQNTAPIVRNGLRLRHTDVELHLVKVLSPEELKGKTTVQLSDEIYELMISDLGEDFRVPREE